MPVQAHARFQPETISRCETGPPDFSAVGEEGFGDASGELRGAVAGLGRDADFEPVFAGVAGAGDEKGGGVEGRGGGGFGEGELEPAAVAEVEAGEVRVDGGIVGVVVGESLEEFCGGGALQGEEGVMVERVPVDCVRGGGFGLEEGGEFGADEGEIGVAAAGVGDEVEGVFADAGDDCVVDDAAGWVGGEEA